MWITASPLWQQFVHVSLLRWRKNESEASVFSWSQWQLTLFLVNFVRSLSLNIFLYTCFLCRINTASDANIHADGYYSPGSCRPAVFFKSYRVEIRKPPQIRLRHIHGVMEISFISLTCQMCTDIGVDITRRQEKNWVASGTPVTALHSAGMCLRCHTADTAPLQTDALRRENDGTWGETFWTKSVTLRCEEVMIGSNENLWPTDLCLIAYGRCNSKAAHWFQRRRLWWPRRVAFVWKCSVGDHRGVTGTGALVFAAEKRIHNKWVKKEELVRGKYSNGLLPSLIFVSSPSRLFWL